MFPFNGNRTTYIWRIGESILQLSGLVVSEIDQQRAQEFCRLYQEQKDRFLLSGLAKCEVSTDDLLHLQAAGTVLLSGVQPTINRDLLVAFARELGGLLHSYISENFHNIIPETEVGSETGDWLLSLVEQTLRGKGEYLSIVAREIGVPLDLLAFFAVYLTRPLRQAAAPTDKSAFGGWQLGYCPVCGLWPRMGRISSEDNSRHLWCIGCETTWAFPRLRCPFCLEDDQGKLGYLKIADTERYRIYTCDSCRRYLKTVIDQGATEISDGGFDAQYLLTSSLDVTAVFEKYIQDFVGFAAFDLQDSAAAKRYREKVTTQT